MSIFGGSMIRRRAGHLLAAVALVALAACGESSVQLSLDILETTRGFERDSGECHLDTYEVYDEGRTLIGKGETRGAVDYELDRCVVSIDMEIPRANFYTIVLTGHRGDPEITVSHDELQEGGLTFELG